MADLLQQMLDALKHPLSEYTHAVALYNARLGEWYVLAFRTAGVERAAAGLDYVTAASLAEEFTALAASMKRLKGAAHEQDG